MITKTERRRSGDSRDTVVALSRQVRESMLRVAALRDEVARAEGAIRSAQAVQAKEQAQRDALRVT